MLRINRLRRRAQGQRAFILANGPSVLSLPLEHLAGELVIGMNASVLLEEERGFAISYYVLGDRRFLIHPEKRRLATTRLRLETKRLLRADLAPDDDLTLQKRTAYVRPLGRDGFSRNLAAGFYHGCTTALFAMQLASWLGCAEIYLLGVDLLYRPEQPRFYPEGRPQEEDVFTSVQVHNLALAVRECAEIGIRVAGCSEHSLLRPYVPYAPFHALFPTRMRRPA
jgi:hypothetical protein